jgi:hypothetical protein
MALSLQDFLPNVVYKSHSHHACYMPYVFHSSLSQNVKPISAALLWRLNDIYIYITVTIVIYGFILVS